MVHETVASKRGLIGVTEFTFVISLLSVNQLSALFEKSFSGVDK
jgi:hypothetical protein